MDASHLRQISLLFYANGSKEKKGIVSIIGRVTINGTVSQFSCNVTSRKNFGMLKGTRLKGNARKPERLILSWIISRHKSSSTTSAYPTVKRI